MPRLTEVSDVSNDSILTVVINKLNSVADKIGTWVNEKYPSISPRVLYMFAGSARNELHLTANQRNSQVIISDAHEKTMVNSLGNISEIGLTHADGQCLDSPLGQIDPTLVTFDLVTCLCISFLNS